MGGLRAVAEDDLWVAVTGAWGAVRIDGRDADPYTAHAWPAGAELQLDWFAHGARAYVAVRGGLDGRLALGSRATDLLAGLGPAALRAGDVVGIRDDALAPIPVAPPAAWGAPHDDELELDLAPGPRADWFTHGGADDAVRHRVDRLEPRRPRRRPAGRTLAHPRRARASSRARAWSRARCRCRPAAGPRSSSPMVR